MIKAMLWKQWRETGIIFLGFLLLMIFASFGFLNSCQYRSLRETSFLYHFIWCGFALTLAADLFVGDKNQGMEEFSRALPCHRLKICAIKFLYGAMMQILFGLVLGVIGFVVYQMQISSGHIFYDALYHITSATIESKQLPPIIYIFSPYILVLSFYTLSCALSVLCNTILESLLVGFAFWLIFSSLTIVCIWAVLALNLPWLVFFVALVFLASSIWVEIRHPNVRSMKIVIATLGILLVLVLITPFMSTLYKLRFTLRYIPTLTGISWPYVVVGSFWIHALIAIIISSIFTCFFYFRTQLKSTVVFCNTFFSASLACSIALIQIFLPQILEPKPFALQTERREKDYEFLQISFAHTATRGKGISQRNFLLNKQNGKLYTYAKEHPFMHSVLDLSPDNKYIIYFSPVLKYGFASDFGIWVENLENNHVSLLTTQSLYSSRWQKNGKKLALCIKEGQGTKLQVIDMESKKTISRFFPKEAYIIISFDKSLYISDYKMRIFELGENLKTLKTHSKIYDSENNFPYDRFVARRMILHQNTIFFYSHDDREKSTLWSYSLASEQLQKVYEQEGRIVYFRKIEDCFLLKTYRSGKSEENLLLFNPKILSSPQKLLHKENIRMYRSPKGKFLVCFKDSSEKYQLWKIQNGKAVLERSFPEIKSAIEMPEPEWSNDARYIVFYINAVERLYIYDVQKQKRLMLNFPEMKDVWRLYPSKENTFYLLQKKQMRLFSVTPHSIQVIYKED